MYDRPYDRSYDNRYLDKKKGKSRKDSEKIALTTKSVDQAYETMFDNDDDMLGNKQTMPWFDPNYLAPNRDDVSFNYILYTMSFNYSVSIAFAIIF